MIAKVEPLTPARSLRGPFDYLLGDALGDVGVGSMLVVPFGPRRLIGVVVEVAEESELPPERLAEPMAALEADVPPALVKLGLWVAREYCSTPARGLALVLPPGTGTGAARPLKRRRSLRAELIARLRTADLPKPGPTPAGRARRPRQRAAPGDGAGEGHGLRPLHPPQPRAARARAARQRRPRAAAAGDPQRRRRLARP